MPPDGLATHWRNRVVFCLIQCLYPDRNHCVARQPCTASLRRGSALYQHHNSISIEISNNSAAVTIFGRVKYGFTTYICPLYLLLVIGRTVFLAARAGMVAAARQKFPTPAKPALSA